MEYDLTEGSITKRLLRFAFPLMLGNLLQQFYNVADTWIVGRFLGSDALAAVGSSYTLMVFLTSILLEMCIRDSWRTALRGWIPSPKGMSFWRERRPCWALPIW